MTGRARKRTKPVENRLEFGAAGTGDHHARRIAENTNGFKGFEGTCSPPDGVLRGGERGRAGQAGMHFGHQRADVDRRRDCRRRVVIARGLGDQVDCPRPTVHRAWQVLVDVGHQRLRSGRRLPGDQSPRGRHPAESGVAQDPYPQSGGMRAVLQMCRPLHHRSFADDHRLVGLVDSHRPLARRRTVRPGPQRESSGRCPAVHRGQPREQRLRDAVTGLGPPPVADGIPNHRQGGQAVGVGDDRKTLALSEFERVKHPRGVSQSALDVARRPAR
jgi:hypothetical protein